MSKTKDGFELIKSYLPTFYQFHRSTLTTAEMQVYDILSNGIAEFTTNIKISGVDLQQINKIYNFIKKDNPLFFYVESISINYEPIKRNASINPQYRFDKQKTNNTIIALLSKVKSILVPLVNANDYYKEKSIHDYFCVNDFYDTNFAESSYECVGPLLFGKGVCEGFSKAVKLLCDFSGLQCVVLHGTATRASDANNTEQHAWNKINIEDSFYNLDVTFDLTISDKKSIRYDYFNLSDSEVLRDHNSNEIHLIPCLQSQCYYMVNHQMFSTTREIKKFFMSSLVSKKKTFILKIADNAHGIREKEVLKCFNDALVLTRHLKKTYQYSYNDCQNVIQIDLL